MSLNGNKNETHEVSADAIESGQHFAMARQWYQLLYEMPVVERSIAIFISALCIVTAFIALEGMLSLYPLRKHTPVFVQNDAIGYEVPHLRHLKLFNDEPLAASVSRLIAERYVEARETFIFDRRALSEQDRMVFQHSNPAAFQAFRRWLQPNNPQSPVNTLGNVWTRTIDNLSVKISLKTLRKGVFEGTATANFTYVLRSKHGNKTKRGQATVKFEMPKIVVEPNSTRVLQYDPSKQRYVTLDKVVALQVTSYQSTGLSGGITP